MSFDLDRVPAALRKPFPGGIESFQIFLAAQLATTDDVDAAAAYFASAIAHQRMLPAPGQTDDDTKGFPGTLVDFGYVSRKTADGKLLGKKLELVFAENKRDSDERETIETGWVEYHGFDYEGLAFELALSNSIADFVEAALKDSDSAPVWVVKHVAPILKDGKPTQKKSRQAIHIERGYAKRSEA